MHQPGAVVGGGSLLLLLHLILGTSSLQRFGLIARCRRFYWAVQLRLSKIRREICPAVVEHYPCALA
jgi:hypothetical protein